MKALTGIILAAFALPGCKSVPPDVHWETKEVQVPVSMPCVVKMPDEPAWEVGKLSAASSDQDVALAFIVERRQRVQYLLDVQAAVAGCSK